MAGGKVLFVATVYTHLAAFHLPFMRMLQDWGYEVHAAASPAEGRKDEVAAAGAVCHDIPFARSFASPAHLSALRALLALFRRERYALIHVHTPAAAWLGRLAARLAHQGPVLYTAHGFHFYRGAPPWYWLAYRTLERLAARWTDGLVVMNEEDYQAARGMGFVPGRNLFLVHGVGVEVARYADAAPASREDLRLPAGAKVALCVAELIPRKNHFLLLSAWQEVAREVPAARLLLVGDGVLRERVQSWVREMGLSGSVRLLGFRRDVPNLLALADVLTLTSKHEGLPRAVMEAMAAGKPVVATDVRGSRDLVRHGVNGFLVPLDEPGALARYLVMLLKDPTLARKMGERGRDLIRPYALENVLQEMAEVYRRFL
ncbi:MAG: glycosyltransferase family 4 protein [Moorellales bacterium]